MVNTEKKKNLLQQLDFAKQDRDEWVDKDDQRAAFASKLIEMIEKELRLLEERTQAFNEAKIETWPSGRNDTTVHYNGHYAGAVVKIDNNSYQCAVSMERKGEWILQRFSTVKDINSAIRDVAHQYWLMNYYQPE